jgi:translation initiation factor IF-2
VRSCANYNSVTGKLATLKQKQSDVSEVKIGIECGIMFQDFDAFEVGDLIQLYEDVEQKRYL